jgi:hypothetical protein
MVLVFCVFLQVNTRLQGNTGPINGLMNASAAVKIPEDATPSQMLEVVINTLRQGSLSVESIFSQFDADVDGTLDQPEFYMVSIMTQSQH